MRTPSRLYTKLAEVSRPALTLSGTLEWVSAAEHQRLCLWVRHEQLPHVPVTMPSCHNGLYLQILT